VLLAGKANEIGYPVLIKARAGGGGKGMRRVDRPEEFPDALSGARREAKAAFGDDAVLIEKYVEKPRHIEVQVFGDSFGNAVHLFERDCSAQRRHQKVIEEAPAPGMTEAMRTAMTGAAVKAARAIRYSGAGTIEFIVDASQGLRPDRFWFMEMNTRLQVEHPVTEMVTGVDLVEWQLRVAPGEPLPLRAGGDACSTATPSRRASMRRTRRRLPAGRRARCAAWRVPQVARRRAGAAHRDRRARTGEAMTPFYDPMIAKLVVKAASRPAALTALTQALGETEVAGSTVNVPFLVALANDHDFAAGDVDTALIGRRQDALTALPGPSRHVAALAALAASGARGGADPADPWDALAGYAHFHPLGKRVTLKRSEDALAARITARRDGRHAVAFDDGETLVLDEAHVAAARTARWPGHVTVFEGPVGHGFSIADPFEAAEDAAAGGDALRAPMPGLVKVVRAAAGDTVRRGQALLVLEAMKMEHTIAAPHDGVIDAIATEGAQVSEGTVLVRFREG
jgi:3-methylcrotonyl-CoA carboxylase alpha subunit